MQFQDQVAYLLIHRCFQSEVGGLLSRSGRPTSCVHSIKSPYFWFLYTLPLIIIRSCSIRPGRDLSTVRLPLSHTISTCYRNYWRVFHNSLLVSLPPTLGRTIIFSYFKLEVWNGNILGQSPPHHSPNPFVYPDPFQGPFPFGIVVGVEGCPRGKFPVFHAGWLLLGYCVRKVWGEFSGGGQLFEEDCAVTPEMQTRFQERTVSLDIIPKHHR